MNEHVDSENQYLKKIKIIQINIVGLGNKICTDILKEKLDEQIIKYRINNYSQFV